MNNLIILVYIQQQQKIRDHVQGLKVKEWAKINQPYANKKEVFLTLLPGRCKFPVKSMRWNKVSQFVIFK